MYAFGMNSVFKEFVEWAGGVKEAAEMLGVTPGYVYHLKNGKRDMTKDMAEQCEIVSDGVFNRAAVLWDDPSECYAFCEKVIHNKIPCS